MVKFSIIVPIYNIESYLDACLLSILKQTINNYEVIMVNDGSSDSSKKVMDKYEKLDKRFKSFTKENGGLSDARNFGVTKSSGEYIVFVDGDDTINEELLFKLNEEIGKNTKPDLIKFNVLKIGNNKSSCNKNEVFSCISGEEAFKKLINNDLFVTAWSYAYKKDYWLREKFSYAYGRVHEDFGLTPLVVIKASSVSSIDYIGYNYMIREGSIMTSNNYEKLRKKINDMLYYFNYLTNEIEDVCVDESSKKIYKSYIANAMITRASGLDLKLLKEYINELKKMDISAYLLDDTLKRKLKKFLYRVNPYLYIKIFVK